MKLASILIVVCLVVASVNAAWINDDDINADPPRPVLKEQFETQFTVHTVDPVNGTIVGNGWWAVDTPKGHASERMQYQEAHKHKNIHIITRYDNKTQYVVTHDPHQGEHCDHTELTGDINPTWDWLKDAKYTGKKKIGDHVLNTWTWKVDTASIMLAVNETHANHPQYYEQKHNHDYFELHFHHYQERVPHPREFEVPKVCHKE